MDESSSSLDVRQILDCLPHRYPFLLVDRVVDYAAGEWLTAIKNVTINEPFFPGHFPGQPVMPGVLILEALAQATGILAYVSGKAQPSARSVYYFVGIDKARFKKPVTPGDRLVLHVSLTRSIRGLWRFAAEAKVDETLVAQAELMTTVREADS